MCQIISVIFSLSTQDNVRSVRVVKGLTQSAVGDPEILLSGGRNFLISGNFLKDMMAILSCMLRTATPKKSFFPNGNTSVQVQIRQCCSRLHLNRDVTLFVL